MFLFFVATTDEENDAANDCTQIELQRADGTFDRFDFHPGTKDKPKAPKYEWKFKLKKNSQSTGVI